MVSKDGLARAGPRGAGTLAAGRPYFLTLLEPSQDDRTVALAATARAARTCGSAGCRGEDGHEPPHFDLWPTPATRDEQVKRAIDLSAVVLDDRRRADGAGWVVFADPEGNEFCIRTQCR